MEQSLRLILVQDSKLDESVINNVYTKLTASEHETYAPDLYILAAERFFEFPLPISRSNIDKAEQLINTYSKLQEPMNQFQIRSLICQALINSHRSRAFRGDQATEMNLKAIDLMFRALQIIQGNNLYQPIGLRAVFLFYEISFPFFCQEQRHHLQAVVPIAVSLLEPHLTAGEYNSVLKLYRELSILFCCLTDDAGKSDEASKQMIKILSLIPSDRIQERYQLFHYVVHFTRKSSGGLAKQKLDLNEQLQKAIVMYQTARSNNATVTKDLAEALKVLTTYLDSKKEYNAESEVAEIVIGEIGRLAAQFKQDQVAQDCLVRAQGGRSQIGHFHAYLIQAELGLNSKLKHEERLELINNQMQHIITSTNPVPDLIMLQDAAALQWSHALHLIKKPQCLKRALAATAHILQVKNSQAYLLRSEMHFVLAKIYEMERDILKALDQLKRALQLDYLVSDHPTKLIHPFDRYLVPYYRVLNVMLDSYGQQTNTIDSSFANIALPKKVNPASVNKALEILQGISQSTINDYNAVDCAHWATAWCELVKAAASIGADELAVTACQQFLSTDLNPAIYDNAVEIQCDATVHGIASCFKLNPPNSEAATSFVQFSLTKSKALKIQRLSYNTISAIWNSFFSNQEPDDCVSYQDLLADIVQTLFESNLPESVALIGQLTNFYVRVLLIASNEPVPVQTTTPTKGKKSNSVDPAKQKLLKTAEDIVIKAIPMVTSIYEKKAIIDRLVTIFGQRNQLPPNQNDPENSILVTLATIMNEKVQHKPETLTGLYSQIQNPVLYALLAEKACKLDLHQVTIDSATKAIDLFQKPKNKDELYHVGLARFFRGLAFLNMIQPDLQEFSCQDKLRHDSATDFLNSARYFHQAKSIDNAKQALSYFVSTLSFGENFPKFRSLLKDVLIEAIEISRKVVIGDELRVRLFRIYLLALIDQCEWNSCRKLINQAITQLDKSVHCKIWDLVLLVTANADCSKTEQPLIDEMLRVKQLGDSKYQSGLWTYVADLAHNSNVQKTALTKALDVLKPADQKEIFSAALNLAKWMDKNGIDEYEDVLRQALVAISTSEPAYVIEYQFEIAIFKLKAAKSIEAFKYTLDELMRLTEDLWSQTITVNSTTEEDEEVKATGKKSSRGQKMNSHRSSLTPKDSILPSDFRDDPASINDWMKLIQLCEHHKPPIVQEPFQFVENLLEIIDIVKELGGEFNLLRLWYEIFLQLKHSLKNARYEQMILLKFKIFLDRLNFVSPFKYSNDFSLTEEERAEWNQKVGRYQSDPPSSYPPLRSFLVRQARLLIDIGQYKTALMLINTALNQSEQLNDLTTQAKCMVILAEIQLRSGEMQRSIEYLAKSAQLTKMPLDFWIDWFTVAFEISNCDEHLVHFQQACIHPHMSIADQIAINKLYMKAAEFLSPDEADSFLKQQREIAIDPSFLPYLDLNLVYVKRILSSPDYPKNLVHYREIGRDLLGLIDSTSEYYENVAEDGPEDATLPMLTRFVEAVNLFGYLIVKYSPVIQGYEINGLDINAIGSCASLLTEFMDKTQEPLPDYSPTSAIMHFNTIQNIPNIPIHQAAVMNVLLGQCLHIISNDNVTLQNSVKFLWKGSNMLVDLKQYELAGDIAIELYSILRASDMNGAIYQYLLAQSVSTYRMRINILMSDLPPNNRETLFIKEYKRARNQFMQPENSQIFLTAQKFFDNVPNGTSLTRVTHTMADIRHLVQSNKNCCLILIDNIHGNSGITAAVICLGEVDTLNNTPISIDFEEAAIKFEIFKQIISTAKAPPVNNAEPSQNRGSSSKGRSKGKKSSKAVVHDVSTAEDSASFAKEAMKLNNPEFTQFINDLNVAFEPMRPIMPEKYPDTCLILSSIKDVFAIPFDCLEVFSGFTTIYRDFSIMSALNRKSLLTDTPTFEY